MDTKKEDKPISSNISQKIEFSEGPFDYVVQLNGSVLSIKATYSEEYLQWERIYEDPLSSSRGTNIELKLTPEVIFNMLSDYSKKIPINCTELKFPKQLKSEIDDMYIEIYTRLHHDIENVSMIILNSRVVSANDRLNSKVSVLKNKCDNITHQLTNDIKNCQAALEAADDVTESHANELKNITKRITQIEQSSSTTTNLINASQTELQNITKRITQIEQSSSTSTNLINASQTELQNITKRITQLEQSSSTTTNLINASQTELQNITKKLTQIEQTLNNNVNQLTARILAIEGAAQTAAAEKK